MKLIVEYGKCLSILLVLFFNGSLAAEQFNYQKAGIVFEIDQLQHDPSSSKAEPASIVFKAGKSPFSVSVLFRLEEENKTLNEFVKQHIKEVTEAGYLAEITTQEVKLDGYTAFEITRHSPYQVIHWYLFQKHPSQQVYSFWLTENKSLKAENKQALAAYELMKNSLEFVKEKP